MRSKNKQQQQFALSHKEKFQSAGSLCYIIEFYLDCWVTLVRFLSIVRIDLKIDKKKLWTKQYWCSIFCEWHLEIFEFKMRNLIPKIWKLFRRTICIWYGIVLCRHFKALNINWPNHSTNIVNCYIFWTCLAAQIIFTIHDLALAVALSKYLVQIQCYK